MKSLLKGISTLSIKTNPLISKINLFKQTNTSINSLYNNISHFNFARKQINKKFKKPLTEQEKERRMLLKDQRTDKIKDNALSQYTQYDPESPTNNLVITPYFNAVDKRELSFDQYTEPLNNVTIRGPMIPKKQVSPQKIKFLKKVKVIRDHVKRELDDKTM